MPPRRKIVKSSTRMLPARPGDIAETTIERIVPGGLGLGYGGGRTLFVSRAAVGDVLKVHIDRDQGRVAHASIVEILTPGPNRIEPPYPRLADCGADFQHLTYDAQLAARQAIVADCLRRIAGIELLEPVPIIPSPDQWRYRVRAEWRLDPRADVLGYLKHGSHDVVDIPYDPLVLPALSEVYEDLRLRLTNGELPDGLREIRCAAGDNGVSLAPSFNGQPSQVVTLEVAGETYAFDANCFFQANLCVLDMLVEEALKYAPRPGDVLSPATRKALDLYCGVGLFTLPLARRFEQTIGVEAHAEAAGYARLNADAAGLNNVRIETDSVERWLENAYRTHGRVPFVLLDPPRTGLPTPAMQGLLRLRPQRIAYVSCDPATLARDIRVLVGSGYELLDLVAIDMFPQTHHVETVAHLARVG
ncbi:MAG: class I SAM-dependent RNA methyltransferase [Thermomicrobiales bacterium]|nr:class I SAM-dependent RNA methyltransferase [Thermomicrobiales bacterium]